MKLKKIVVGAFTCFMSISALATPDWIEIGADDYSIDDIDKNSIKRFSQTNPHTTHKAWLRQTYLKDDRAVRKGDKYIALVYFNCHQKTSGLKQLTISGENNLVKSTNTYKTVEMSEAVPGSMGDSIIDYVCSRY